MQRFVLIICFLLAGTAAARSVTDKAVLHAREGAAALLRGKYERAIVSYSEALKSKNLQDPRRANIYNDRGVAKWRLKRPKEAILDFNEAVELFPDYAMVYNNRGNALMELRRPEEALRDFERAIALAPAYGAAYNNRGNALFAMGRLDEARKAYRKAAELMPSNAVPFNGRGKTHMAQQRPFAAIRDYTRAISLDARYGSAYSNRALALERLELTTASVSDLTQAIAHGNKRADLYMARASAFLRRKQYASAVQDLSKAIELEPTRAGAHRMRGAIQAKLKRASQAHADLSKAIELNGNDAEAYAERGWNYLRQGLKEEALGDVTRALEIDPAVAVAYRVRGAIHEAHERVDEAIADYRKALGLDPKQAGSRAALKRLTGEEPASAEATEEAVESVGEPVEGWTVMRRADGRYLAFNPKFPKVRAWLEMYGEGVPEILEWEIPRNGVKGVGLLRYRAGASADETEREQVYVAIVDLWKARVVAIEPYSWGSKKAKWSWNVASVVVTDPAGMASEVRLRKARRQPDQYDPNAPGYGDDYWLSGRPATAARQRPQRRRSSGNLFNWLFGN